MHFASSSNETTRRARRSLLSGSFFNPGLSRVVRTICREDKIMNEITESVKETSRTLRGPESSSRRLFVKGVAGLGATVASSSFLSAGAPAQSQARQTAPPGNEAAPPQSGWGPFTPSGSAGRYLQLVYPPSTTAGELHLGVTYTLWIPDGVQTVRARSEE